MGIHDPRYQKRPKNRQILFQKVSEIDAIKAPEKQFFIGKRRSGSKSRKNDHEAKTYVFGSHLEAILASSWNTWEAFGGHFGHFGANLIGFGRSVECLGRFSKSSNWFGTVGHGLGEFKTGTWVL